VVTNPSRRRIVFAVTVDFSINLLGEIPKALSKEGWDVHLVSNPGPELAEAARQNYATCHPIPMTRDPSILRDLGSFFRWMYLLAKIRPDVISVGTPKASLLGLLAGWVLRVPHRVYVLRGLRLETTFGFQLRLLSALETLTSACATQIIAVSPSLRALYLKTNLTRPEKIMVLGHGSSKGVDPEKFRPAIKAERIGLRELATEIGLREKIPVIGLVGRHGKDKGLEVFFDALAILNKNKVRYQVLAIGDDESEGALTQSIRTAKSQVIAIPRVVDLERHLRLLDVLCLPTLREGLPNVALEAQASGVPVVTTDATGAIDSVENEVTGLVVPAGQANDLAEALTKILLTPSYRSALGSMARPWVLSRFGSATATANNVQFYARLCE